jgi:hypothetical protein
MNNITHRILDEVHWIRRVAENHYEMVMDHQMLSSWRMCEAHFNLTHVHGYVVKSQRNWSLEFGTVFHRAVEEIYKMRKQNGTSSITYMDLAQLAAQLWDRAGLDVFEYHRTFKQLGGKQGFIALVMQYATFYSQDTERLRILDTEVGFGRNREVPLGTLNFSNNTVYDTTRVDCFLSGRIDFLADDGRNIGPVDHKTRSVFANVEHILQYNPHEGITGYIYAVGHIIKKRHPVIAAQRRTNSAWLNFVQVANESDPLKRFKRGLVMRTDYQLEQWRLRQLTTFEEIFRWLRSGHEPTWNTEVCTHWYGVNCVYHAVHRQPDAQSQLTVLNTDYVAGKYWNPEEVDNGNGVSGDSTTDKAKVQEQGILDNGNTTVQ